MPANPDTPARTRVAGVDFDSLGQEEVMEGILTAFEGGLGGRTVFVNVDVAVRLRRSPELARLVSTADLVLADGMPLVWASRLQRTPLPERVAGSNLLPALAPLASEREIGVLLVGGRHGAAETAAGVLMRASPGLRVGWHTPPFGFERDPGAKAGIEAALRRFGRCVCFVGLGFPKQERLMADLTSSFPDSWFIASGASIDMLADDRRAPGWMQRSGVEWLHRMWREPRRLGRRYLLDDVPFATAMLAASAWAGLGRK